MIVSMEHVPDLRYVIGPDPLPTPRCGTCGEPWPDMSSMPVVISGDPGEYLFRQPCGHYATLRAHLEVNGL